jgi:hypothetical protein
MTLTLTILCRHQPRRQASKRLGLRSVVLAILIAKVTKRKIKLTESNKTVAKTTIHSTNLRIAKGINPTTMTNHLSLS